MNIEAFIAPLEAENSSGNELRNDARFHALERRLEPASREARMKTQAESGSGDTTIDWTSIVDDARSLAASGRDLRLLVIVSRALTNETGFDGMSKGITLLTRSIVHFWDNLHPVLRPDPSAQQAALRRINALRQLENQENGLLGDLEFNTMLRPRGLGLVSGGDLAAAALGHGAFMNEVPKGLGEKERAEIVAKHEARVNRVGMCCRAMLAEQPGVIEAMLATLVDAQSALDDLEAALDLRVFENNVGVRFGKLTQFLARISQTLTVALISGRKAEESGMPDTLPRASAPLSTTTSAAVASSGIATEIPVRIASRGDVERCLDLIIEFYERTEPSSPIPHLARRMRKMVPMNFIQLMEEVAPAGIKEFRSIAGMFDAPPK